VEILLGEYIRSVCCVESSSSQQHRHSISNQPNLEMKSTYAASGIVALAGAVSAQQTLWGQCGGINYTGQTSCVSGSNCSYLNDWYYQCIPG
jgi:hypothetical protein